MGIQANLAWENPKQNCLYFQKQIEATNTKLDVVVLPEMFTTGFSMDAKQIAENLEGDTVSWMKSMAKKNDFAICGSLAIKEKETFYNRFIFVHPSGKMDFYDKKHAFTLAGEHKAYKTGNERKIITFRGWKICPQICYDLRFPVWSRNTKNYDVLIYVANWPNKRNLAWQTLLKARAIENMAYTIGINRVGTDANNLTYSGDSMIVDYLGKTLTNLKAGEEGVVITSLEKDSQNLIRKELGFLNNKDNFELL